MEPTPFDKVVAADMGTTFADMTQRQKWVFVTKLVICIGTFGFVFPNIQKE
jgi:hypothetical protein